MSNWIYDEYKHCGVDYSSVGNADNCDNRHTAFRDYKKEFYDMLEFLGLKDIGKLSMIDLGCGTGASTIIAAEHFKHVYGVDVSDAMLLQAKNKVCNKTKNNIEFIKAGFLTYEHKDEPVDLLITKAAFHHLPDFWKQIALLRMNKMIKAGGSLYIFDIVFHFNPCEYKEKISEWISDFEKNAGAELRKEVEIHIRDEYSTFGWILDGMLERAGFSIKKCRSGDEFITEYHCIKEKEVGFLF